MARQGMNRREVLRALAMAAAASRVGRFSRWVFACESHVGGLSVERLASYAPKFFSPHEYETLERLTDMIIPSDGTPGAREAGVAEFIDFMVAHDQIIQYPFRLGLAWLDAEVERTEGGRFLGLSPDKQTAMLERLAYHDRFREGEEDGRDFFHQAREYTVMGYDTSRAGLEEIDYPVLQLYAESPACPHKGDPEHKLLSPPKV